MVHWLGLHASTAGGTGSIPDYRTKVLQDVQHGQENPHEKNCEVYQLSAVKHSHIVLQPVPRSLFVLQD